jgi:PAS domain S-box-containing protein
MLKFWLLLGFEQCHYSSMVLIIMDLHRPLQFNAYVSGGACGIGIFPVMACCFVTLWSLPSSHCVAAVRLAPAAITMDLAASRYPLGNSLSGALGIAAGAGLLGAVALLVYLMYRLREEKAVRRELFEQVPFAAALATLDQRIIRINRGFTDMFGYTSEAAVGRQIGELIIPVESQDEYRMHADRVAHGQPVKAEGIRRRQDGSRFPAAVTYLPVSAPGREGAFCAIFRDITKQRRDEEAHTASEGLWRAVFDNSAVGIALADLSGKLTAANRAYQELLGYSEEELRTLSFMDLTAEEDRPVCAALIADVFAGILPRFQLEKRMRRKDGASIWVRVTVSKIPAAGDTPAVSIGIVEDITERRRAEVRLREYEKVIEGLQERVAVVDRDYRYLIANQACLDYHGKQAEEVIGHSLLEMLGQKAFDQIKNRLEECFQGRVVRFELSVPYPKTGMRDLSAHYFPIEGPTGVDRIAAILQDVTERKEAERELQRSLLELHALNAQMHSVREEERTRLARELHDELGQALTAIRLDLSSLQNSPKPDQQPQQIRTILGLVDEALRSVRRISTELRPGVLDHLGFVAALEWATEEFEGRTGIQCHVLMPETNLALDSRRSTALFRIFQEALTNIARHAEATKVRIVVTREDGGIALEVRDNGRGIGENQISSSSSLGILGMRERALLLGGEFRISGEPGQGTTVRVRIPGVDRRQAAGQ